jgi:hypothetical protein
MIISHKHKFIFLKTEKTAGTSIEIALSKFCGKDDVITPILPIDEEIRRKYSYLGPQNYFLPVTLYTFDDWRRLLLQRRRPAFYNHAGAKFVKKHVDPQIWEAYFKFCFERNPWDKAISWYYWINQSEPRPSISEFIQSGKANTIKGYDVYTIDGEIVVDRVCFYEQMNQELDWLVNVLRLPEKIELPKAKQEFREDKRNYKEILCDEDRNKISRIYAREIKQFGYE